MKKDLIFLAFILTTLLACNSNYTYKKTGYFRIDFPEKKYQSFDQAGYPYSFEYPVYAKVVKDSMFFNEVTENPWWINIDVPQFGGRIYISYKDVRNRTQLDSMVNDAFKMSSMKHVDIASQIKDSVMQTANGIEGIYWTLEGNTATANQFFLTDSTRHFLRGALYFDAAPNADSLSIVNDFLKKDMLHLISTLKWRPVTGGSK